MTEAIHKELIHYGKNSANPFFDDDENIHTIYFGGGTPSVLSVEDISRLLDTVRDNYDVNPNAEITLEANPDDLKPEFCHELKEAGINRLSIGIQSFYPEHLVWMNRSHTALQASECVPNALAAGISNISMDLIYGFPGCEDEQWAANLQMASNLAISHLSTYCLTVEERTPLKKLIETGRYMAPDEDTAARQFQYLIDWSKREGWDHYEISNLCRNGSFSLHNTGYWKRKKYLGIGPSAHSYNNTQRRWNIKDNKLYIQSLEQNKPACETETLTRNEQLNDLLLTSLRTKWGLDITLANELVGEDFFAKHKSLFDKYFSLNLLKQEAKYIQLTDTGKFFADGIASEFFAT